MMLHRHQRFGNNKLKPISLIENKLLNDLQSDIEYLQYEAESLYHVIEFVPYSEKPLDGASITEIFLNIDSIQVSITDVIKDLTLEGSNLDISEYHIFENIELSKAELVNYSIESVISSIKENRVNLIKEISSKESVFYEIEIKENDTIITIFELLKTMIKQERALLRKIAELVMTYQSDRQFQRQLKSSSRD